jgi:Tlde1 domain
MNEKRLYDARTAGRRRRTNTLRMGMLISGSVLAAGACVVAFHGGEVAGTGHRDVVAVKSGRLMLASTHVDFALEQWAVANAPPPPDTPVTEILRSPPHRQDAFELSIETARTPASQMAVPFAPLGSADTLLSADAVHGPAPRPIGLSVIRRAEFRAFIQPTTQVASLPPAEAAPVVQTAPATPAATSSPPVAEVEPSEQQPAAEAVPVPPPAPHDTAELEVPVPQPRPAEVLQDMASEETPTVPRRSRRMRQAQQALAVPQAPAVQQQSDNRGFFQKLLSGNDAAAPRANGQALAYAAPPSPDNLPRSQPLSRGFGLFSSSSTSGGTAVYDISARTVYLPNGEKLEAHSGMGDKRDDPRHVNVAMRGATPPHIYDLSEREALFHGVQALRLTPVGGSGAIYNRVGLLAHTYMLGPKGDSNGCISFKDYNRFLQAYRRGEVKRLVVVANSG